MAHPLGIQLYLILLDVAAYHVHLCHAPGRKQARANNPVGHRAQVKHGGGVGTQAYDEHLAQDGRLRTQRGVAHPFGQVFLGQDQLLADNLSRQVDVRIPVKLHPDDGEPVGGR